MDPLDGVAVFVTVVQIGSFSAAAERLGCSKATVSSHVARLEKRVGARLLHRSTRCLSLTEAGQVYLDRMGDVLERAEQASLAAQAQAREPRGQLRISAPSPFAWTHVAPLLPGFLREHPDVSIDLQASGEVVDLVAGQFDLAIRLCPTNEPHLIVRRLGGTRLILCAAPAFLLHYREPREPSELADLPCLFNSLSPWKREWRLTQDGREERVALSGAFMTNSGEALRELVLGGAGIAMIPEYVVAEDLRSRRLLRVLAHWDLVEVPVLVVYPDNRQIAAKVRAFVDYLARHMDVDSACAANGAEPPRRRQFVKGPNRSIDGLVGGHVARGRCQSDQT